MGMFPWQHAGRSNGDPVTQTKGNVLISRGESVVVNCTYEAASPFLFWYVQFPSQPPRLFLRDLGREDSDEGIRKGFDATHDKKQKSFHLWKPASDSSDSATYYCAVRDTVTQTGRELSENLPGAVAGTAGSWERAGVEGEEFCTYWKGIYGDSVNQTEGIVMVFQGDPVLLNCTYEFLGYPSPFCVTVYPFWYVHFPNQALRLLLRDLGREDSDEGIRKGFNATHDKKLKSFHLWKPASELSDSATYYCAASDTVTRSSA
ncbi:unnamed protein product [Caretta caretta]